MPRPPHRILVCDDDEDVRALLDFELAAVGFTTLPVPSGSEALQLLSQEHVDLMILDLVMPGISGLEVLRRLRRMPEGHQPPTIILTAIDEAEMRTQCRELGAVAFVAKPIEFQGLVKAILTVILGWEDGETPVRRPA